MSIFLKDCPECAAANPVHALSCRCGYSFDPKHPSKRKDELAHLEQEEQLYLEYLHARVAQTGSDLKAKQTAQTQAPEDTARAAEVLIAQQALATARAELRAQIDKIDSLRNRGRTSTRAPAARPAMPPARPMPAASHTAAPTTQKPPQQPRNPRAAAAPVATAPSAHKPIAQPQRPAASAAPTEAFRAAQNARAAQVVTQRTAETAAPQIQAPVPALPAAREPVARQAQAVAAPLPATHDCPNCTARLPIARDRCGCGYSFASSADMPPLVLSAEDREKLLNNLGYGS